MSKDNTAYKNNNNENNNGKSNIRGTVLWPLIVGIIIIGFSIILMTLRAIIPSFIIMLTGVSLIIYWIYITRSKNLGNRSRYDKRCLCAICEHAQSSVCIEQKCICCSITRGDKIIGHVNNPLQ